MTDNIKVGDLLLFYAFVGCKSPVLGIVSSVNSDEISVYWDWNVPDMSTDHNIYQTALVIDTLLEYKRNAELCLL